MAEADAELVTRASRGDRVAIESLLERHLPALRAYVRLQAGERVRRRESCSDLVQSVCREVLEDLDALEYRGDAAFRGWLYRAALHKIVDRERHWARQRRDAAREVSGVAPGTESGGADLVACYASLLTPSAVAMGFEGVEQMEQAFDELSQDQQEVVSSVCLLGESYGDIASRLGRSESWCRTVLSRGLARLSLALDGPR